MTNIMRYIFAVIFIGIPAVVGLIVSLFYMVVLASSFKED